MNILDISEKDKNYEFGLIIIGGFIGYFSSSIGGLVTLLVIGAILAVAIGLVSDSLKKAILLGAFFGVIVVTSSSDLVQGHGPNWSGDIVTSVFLPYFKDALVAGVIAGTVAAFGHSLRFRKR